MSREKILTALRASRPAQNAALPPIPHFAKTTDHIARYKQALEENSTVVYEVQHKEDLGQFIRSKFPETTRQWSGVPGVRGYVEPSTIADMASLEVAVVKGELGVAENGATWVSDQNLAARVLPFITQQLVIIIEAHALVVNMHEAYNAIDPHSLGFGFFISGPSKTADIEQALVVGAHGPLGLTVILVNEFF